MLYVVVNNVMMECNKNIIIMFISKKHLWSKYEDKICKKSKLQLHYSITNENGEKNKKNKKRKQ